MNPRDASFTDDSSRALGLGHAATVKPRGGDPVSKLGGPLQRKDVADRELIDRNEREDREKKIVALQRREGWTRKQAEEFVDKEAAVPKGQRPKLSPAERRELELLDLMGVRRKTKGGGGSSAKFKSAKPGTLICSECKLECKFCECRDSEGNRCMCVGCRTHLSARRAAGRPATLNRSHRGSHRVSPKTANALRLASLTPSDALEVAGLAILSSRSYADVAHDYLIGKPCKVCPDKAAGILCAACTRMLLPRGAGRGAASQSSPAA
jgi:hypothetical protein